MQNKPNFQKAKMNVSNIITMNYKNFIPLAGQKNKPNSNPIKANLPKGEIDAKSVFTKDYRKNDDFAVQQNKPNSNPIKANILGLYTATLLQFSCAQLFLANTIYSILPNFPRKTLAAVSGVKMGLLQGWFFSIGKTVFAANLYNFRLSQQLAK